jgi:hypothetical protein
VVLSIAPLLIGLQMLLYALLLDIQESPDSPMTIDYRRLSEPSAGGSVRPSVQAPARTATFSDNLVDGTGHRANGAVRQPGSPVPQEAVPQKAERHSRERSSTT